MSSLTSTNVGVTRLSASSGSTTTTNVADQKASNLPPPKAKSSFRRWFSFVRQVVLSNSARKELESSGEKKSEETLVQTSSPLASSTVALAPSVSSDTREEDVTDIQRPTKFEPNASLKHVARNHQAPFVFSPASVFDPALTKVNLVEMPEPVMVASTPVSQNTESQNVDETMPSKPAKAKRSRKPRKPTMITPEMMQKITKDNKKHQGSSAREVKSKKKSTGAVASTVGVKGVRANPLRWSQD
jgi:hypothetical protein